MFLVWSTFYNLSGMIKEHLVMVIFTNIMEIGARPNLFCFCPMHIVSYLTIDMLAYHSQNSNHIAVSVRYDWAKKAYHVSRATFFAPCLAPKKSPNRARFSATTIQINDRYLPKIILREWSEEAAFLPRQ